MAEGDNPGSSAISITIQSTEATTQTTTQETTTTVVKSVVSFLCDQIESFVDQSHVSLDQLLNITQGVISGQKNDPAVVSAAEYLTIDEIRAKLRDDLELMIRHQLLRALHLIICDAESGTTGTYRAYYDVEFRIMPNSPERVIAVEDGRKTPKLVHIASYLVEGSRAVLLLEWRERNGEDTLARIRGDLQLEWQWSPHIYDFGHIAQDQEHEERHDGTVLVTAYERRPRGPKQS